MRRRVSAGLLLVTTVLVVTGCSADDGAGTRVGADESASGPAVSLESDPVVADIERCPQPKPSGDVVNALPDVELQCLGPGSAVPMSELSGRPMLVNVWASWCAPCRDEMPWLQRAHDSGVTVLGVDAEDQSASASALLDELGVTYPSVFDQGNEFARAFGVITKPLTLFVAADGQVKHVNPGPFESEEQMQQLLEEHLGVELK